MIAFFENYFKMVERTPDACALRDVSTQLSFKKFDELSWKVCAYLKENNIGRENRVLVYLPRDVNVFVSVLGIWKAGAAVLILEKDGPVEREKYIREDCKCDCIIDENVYAQICSKYEGASSNLFADPDEHDAAFIIYTSGSTGFSKGVLHEFGTVNLIMKANCLNEKQDRLVERGDYIANIGSLNFLASYLLYCWSLSEGASLYVVPYEITRDPRKLSFFLQENKVNVLFATPTYVLKFGKFLPKLKRLLVGSEMVKNLYFDDVEVVNLFGSSEIGSVVTSYKIECACDNTPIGKSYAGVDMNLTDSGELRVRNPFTRGYLNKPQMSKDTFREGWVYTGDVARVLPDGNIMLVGRKNEMVKIDGNRVEPGEIEYAVKKVLGVEWTAVKIFSDSNMDARICVYYTENVTFSYELVLQELAKYLPHYMLPHYFVHLDSVPQNANGKLDKFALKLPDLHSMHRPYVAPQIPEECALCNAIKTVLGMDFVGSLDDFFELGGSSLKAMEVVMESGLADLSVAEIYRGRTPQKIIELYLDESLKVTKQGTLCKITPQDLLPLMATQCDIWNAQAKIPDSTMYNIFAFFKILDKVDLNRLVDSLKHVVLCHRALFTQFVIDKNGNVKQRLLAPENIELDVENISESELDSLKDSLVQPFDLLKDRLFRIRIFKTDLASYLFLDFHHIIFDGSSLQIFFKDVEKCYEGVVVAPDAYENTLKLRNGSVLTAEFQKALNWYDNLYQSRNWDMCPKIDFDSQNQNEDTFVASANISPDELNNFVLQKGISRNEFFVAVTLKSIARFNQSRYTMINWAYRTRDTMDQNRTVGALFSCLPVGCDTELPVLDLLKAVSRQVQYNIQNQHCQYLLHKNGYQPFDCVCMLYQGGLRGFEFLDHIVEKHIRIRKNKAKNQNILDVEILDSKSGYVVVLLYDSSRYKKINMVHFLRIWKKTAREMLTVS